MLFARANIIGPFLVAGCFIGRPSFAADAEDPAIVARTVNALMSEEGRLEGVSFAGVVKAATGRRIIPFDLASAEDRALLAKIGAATDRVLAQMNAAGSPARREKRINEVSAHFEQALKDELNRMPGFACDWPRTAEGKIQRSGYPDLRLVDETGKRVIYLDPKLYERGGRNSTLRTFYFEPKKETNKILDDAHHLIVGFEHDGARDGRWTFLNWELVDLSRFKVRLKAEFQGSNRDLYRPEAVVGTSRK